MKCKHKPSASREYLSLFEYSCQQEGAERLVGVCIEEWVKVNLTSMYNEMEGAGAIALPLSIKNGMLTIKKGLDK